RCPAGRSQPRILSLPYWAGSSTLALGPGCCGFKGPVPSATLDKGRRKATQTFLANGPNAVKQNSSLYCGKIEGGVIFCQPSPLSASRNAGRSCRVCSSK